ncbi:MULTISPECIES: hypothetical protein, partial [Niastella]|uniref:hypothetical protein n=1 Tax=Niastella TaxID=354354 RepID=UPI001AD95797
MTNTYNIARTDGSVMVPVLTESGSLMAYVLYPDTTGTLQELYSWMSIPRQFPYSVQAIPRQINTHTGTTRCGTLYYKNAIGCTGQPIIQQSKRKTMSKSSITGATGGASADRIKNDAAFERTRENMAEFSRA